MKYFPLIMPFFCLRGVVAAARRASRLALPAVAVAFPMPTHAEVPPVASAGGAPQLAAPSPVGRWSFAGPALSLRLDQLFPVGYLSDLASGVGVPRLLIEPGPAKLAFKVIAGADIQVAKFELFPAPGRTDALMIEELRLENPLSSRQNIHLSQYKKGLPADVFRYARDRIFEIARAGGFAYLATGGAQNYAVSMLYRRVVGMRPVTAEGEALFSRLDALFFTARKLVPDPFRIDSLDDFAETLGDVGNSSATPDAESALGFYNQFGTFPRGIRTIQSDTALFGFIIPSDPPVRKESVFFLDPLRPDRILQWKNYDHLPAMALQVPTYR